MFHKAPIGLVSWALIVVVEIAIDGVVGIEKWIQPHHAMRREGE